MPYAAIQKNGFLSLLRCVLPFPFVCMCSKLQEWIFSLFLFESVQALEWEKSHSKMALSLLNKSLELSSWRRCDSIAVHVVDGDNFVRLIRQKRWWERESPNQNRIDDKMFKIEFTGFLLHFYVSFYSSFYGYILFLLRFNET